MIEHTVEFTKRIRKATKNSKVVAPSLSPSTPTPTPTPKPNSDDSDSDSDDHPLPHPSPNKQSQKTLVSLNQSQITLQTNLDLLHQYVTNLQAHYKNEQKNLERSSKKCEKVLALQKSLEQQSLAIKEMEQTAETYKNQAHDIKQQVSERINSLLACFEEDENRIRATTKLTLFSIRLARFTRLPPCSIKNAHNLASLGAARKRKPEHSIEADQCQRH